LGAVGMAPELEEVAEKTMEGIRKDPKPHSLKLL
jgi:hypothetical protein